MDQNMENIIAKISTLNNYNIWTNVVSFDSFFDHETCQKELNFDIKKDGHCYMIFTPKKVLSNSSKRYIKRIH